jgi:hypothetical protein
MPGDSTEKSPEWKAVARESLEEWSSNPKNLGESDGAEMPTLRFFETPGAEILPATQRKIDEHTNPEPPVS